MILQVFFDYTCPYSRNGHRQLLKLLPKYPQVTVEWHPCEAHPRPETYGKHSDLVARGMYIAEALGADVMKYHEVMYHSAMPDRANIEDVAVLAQLVDGLCDAKTFADALHAGQHQDTLDENNRLMWDVYSCPATPSYRAEGRLLSAIPGIGVTKDALDGFIQAALGAKESIGGQVHVS